jgi:hypothetical protein
MKKIKTFSLAITMLFCIVAFAQEKVIKINISDTIIDYKISNNLDLNKLQENNLFNLSDNVLIVLDNTISSNEDIKRLNLNEIKEINIIKGAAAGKFICDGSQKNGVIIVTKFTRKELKRQKKNIKN